MSSRPPGWLRRAWSRWGHLVILLVAWCGFWGYAHPGSMSFDSSWQLREARAGHYTNWHPPVMAGLWAILDDIVSGPAGMLFVQSGCFLAGTWLILQRRISRQQAGLATLALLWFPPIGATLAVIWKDSQMVGFVVLGCALLESARRGTRLAGLAVLALATAMRINAFTITLPIVVLLFVWSPALRGWRRHALALAASLAITGAATLANRWLTDEDLHPWHGSVALFDIVGTLRYAGPLSDAEIRAALDGVPGVPAGPLQARFHSCYEPAEGIFAVLNKGCLAQPTNAVQRAAVAEAWRTLVQRYPSAYLFHRWKELKAVLRIDLRGVVDGVWAGFDRTSEVRDRGNPGFLQHRAQRIAVQLGTTWLFRPILYLALLIALSPWWWRSQLQRALALSAIACEAGLYLAVPTPDYRYSVWLVLVAVLLAVMIGFDRLPVVRAKLARRAAESSDESSARADDLRA
jgi:hypothetical protein